MTAPANQKELLTDLLADEALGWLSLEQDQELQTLITPGYTEEGVSLMMTSAVLEVSLIRTSDWEPMPVAVRLRLEASGMAWATAISGRSIERTPGRRRVRPRVVTLSPWVMAAACLTVAIVVWRSKGAKDLVALAERDPNRVIVQLAGWGNLSDFGSTVPPSDPAGAPTLGRLCWSEKGQCGYLKLEGMPVNDCEHQYQIWIIDDRGINERISAGIFDCTGKGCVIPIQPAIPVHNAASFAITMEKQGGTWVSDMTHKVAIGHCSKR